MSSSNSPTRSTSPMRTDANPLKFDPELKDLLSKVESIKKYRHFQKWKNSFLERYLSFLEEDGVEHADTAYGDYGKDLTTYQKMLKSVENHVNKGELSTERKTVKASLSLNEMCKNLTGLVKNTEALIPSTAREERDRQYNKYQLGAVLVRDSFTQYDGMKGAMESLHELGPRLGEVADKQQHELFDNYEVKFQRFCDVMADLGLYAVMLLCRKFAEEPEEESSSESEPEPDPDPIIFVDMKTSSIFEVERDVVAQKGALTPLSPFEYQEAARKGQELDDIKKNLKEHPTLGIAKQLVVQKTEVEDVDVSSAVTNKWGVKLKKRPKNVKGEEFVFIDPKTGAMGELARKKYIDSGFITLTKRDGDDKETLREAEQDNMEYDRIISVIRKLLGIDFS